MEKISELLLSQRIRNRIIEVLELYTSIEAQKYLGPDEIINMWEDWVDDERIATYVEPAFSRDEQRAISVFHDTWNQVCNNTPQIMPPVEELMDDKQWLQLMNDAKKALIIFAKRGQLSEEQEIA